MEGNWGLMVFVDEVCVYHFVYSRMNELCRTLTKMSILEEKNTFNDEIIRLIA